MIIVMDLMVKRKMMKLREKGIVMILRLGYMILE
jgi:hypothetical protein